jgi:hypothetical protein
MIALNKLPLMFPSLRKMGARKQIKAGDVVSILPYDQILQTLDENNCCDGLVFMDNMKQFCNKDYTVLKRVKWIYDEKYKKMQSCKNIVVLDCSVCDGIGMLDGKDCDRCCTLLWKTSWLETK